MAKCLLEGWVKSAVCQNEFQVARLFSDCSSEARSLAVDIDPRQLREVSSAQGAFDLHP